MSAARSLRGRRLLAALIDLAAMLPIALFAERAYKLYRYSNLYLPDYAWRLDAGPFTTLLRPELLATTVPDPILFIPIALALMIAYRAFAEADGAALGKSIAAIEVDRGLARPGLLRSVARALSMFDAVALLFVERRPIDRLLGTGVVASEPMTAVERIGAHFGANLLLFGAICGALATFSFIEQDTSMMAAEIWTRTAGARLRAATVRHDCCRLGRLEPEAARACEEPVRSFAADPKVFERFVPVLFQTSCDRVVAHFVVRTGDVEPPLQRVLAEATRSEDVSVRRRAVEAITRNRIAREALLEMLDDDDDYVLQHALAELASSDVPEDQLAGALKGRLIRLMKRDVQAAWSVSRIIERAREDAAFLVPDLVSLLFERVEVRTVLASLASIGPAAGDSVEAIERVLIETETSTRSEQVREQALRALGRIGARGKPALSRALDRQSRRPRGVAVFAALRDVDLVEHGIGADYGRATEAARAVLRGDATRARELARSTLERHPRDPAALFVLACAELEGGEADLARSTIDRLAAAKPEAKSTVAFMRGLVDARARGASWIAATRAARLAAGDRPLGIPVRPKTREQWLRTWDLSKRPERKTEFQLLQIAHGRRMGFGTRYALEVVETSSSTPVRLLAVSVLRDELEVLLPNAPWFEEAREKTRPQARAALVKTLESLARDHPGDLIVNMSALVAAKPPSEPLSREEIDALEVIAAREPRPLAPALVYDAVKRAVALVDPSQTHEYAITEWRQSYPVMVSELARLALEVPPGDRPKLERALVRIGEKLRNAPTITERTFGMGLELKSMRSGSPEQQEQTWARAYAQIPQWTADEVFLIPIASFADEIYDRWAENEIALIEAL